MPTLSSHAAAMAYHQAQYQAVSMTLTVCFKLHNSSGLYCKNWATIMVMHGMHTLLQLAHQSYSAAAQ
jgi:hypothetical protein